MKENEITLFMFITLNLLILGSTGKLNHIY